MVSLPETELVADTLYDVDTLCEAVTSLLVRFLTLEAVSISSIKSSADSVLV